MTKFFNVVTRRVFNNGIEEKVIHHKVGTVKVTKNGGWFLQMYHQPETDFLIFANQNEELPVIDFGNHEA